MGKSDGQQSGNYTGNWDDMGVCLIGIVTNTMPLNPKP